MRKDLDKLRAKQIEVLQILSRLPKGNSLSLRRLAEDANTYPSSLSRQVLGARNPVIRKRQDEQRGYPSLLSRGYVRAITVITDVGKETDYVITKAGRQALAEVAL
jgi:hypothetical protein